MLFLFVCLVFCLYFLGVTFYLYLLICLFDIFVFCYFWPFRIDASLCSSLCHIVLVDQEMQLCHWFCKGVWLLMLYSIIWNKTNLGVSLTILIRGSIWQMSDQVNRGQVNNILKIYWLNVGIKHVYLQCLNLHRNQSIF